jgi:hypothetical protein
MAIAEGAKTSDRNELQSKLAELQEILARVENRLKLDEETAARFAKPNKMGANLKSTNELQEWL